MKKGKPYYICKKCEREYMVEYRKKNRKELNKQHREYMEEYKKNNAEKIKTYARRKTAWFCKCKIVLL